MSAPTISVMKNNYPTPGLSRRGSTSMHALCEPMTLQNLTALLAQRVMGWTVGPDRFLTGNRTWIRRSRFQPTENLQDAHNLLLAANATEYTLGGDKGQPFWAEVQIGAAQGKAVARSLPIAICIATARALGIAVEVCD
jgi:hypothetical protein